jgi:hypothetical protein
MKKYVIIVDAFSSGVALAAEWKKNKDVVSLEVDYDFIKKFE